jgi:hypothetical protein
MLMHCMSACLYHRGFSHVIRLHHPGKDREDHHQENSSSSGALQRWHIFQQEQKTGMDVMCTVSSTGDGLFQAHCIHDDDDDWGKCFVKRLREENSKMVWGFVTEMHVFRAMEFTTNSLCTIWERWIRGSGIHHIILYPFAKKCFWSCKIAMDSYLRGSAFDGLGGGEASAAALDTRGAF